jgi:hypothetical protein
MSDDRIMIGRRLVGTLTTTVSKESVDLELFGNINAHFERKSLSP